MSICKYKEEHEKIYFLIFVKFSFIVSALDFLIPSQYLQLHCNLSQFPQSVWVFIEVMEHYFQLSIQYSTIQGGPINIRDLKNNLLLPLILNH